MQILIFARKKERERERERERQRKRKKRKRKEKKKSFFLNIAGKNGCRLASYKIDTGKMYVDNASGSNLDAYI